MIRTGLICLANSVSLLHMASYYFLQDYAGHGIGPYCMLKVRKFIDIRILSISLFNLMLIPK